MGDVPARLDSRGEKDETQVSSSFLRNMPGIELCPGIGKVTGKRYLPDGIKVEILPVRIVRIEEGRHPQRHDCVYFSVDSQ